MFVGNPRLSLVVPLKDASRIFFIAENPQIYLLMFLVQETYLFAGLLKLRAHL